MQEWKRIDRRDDRSTRQRWGSLLRREVHRLWGRFRRYGMQGLLHGVEPPQLLRLVVGRGMNGGGGGGRGWGERYPPAIARQTRTRGRIQP